jgi:hypothetical protein
MACSASLPTSSPPGSTSCHCQHHHYHLARK